MNTVEQPMYKWQELPGQKWNGWSSSSKSASTEPRKQVMEQQSTNSNGYSSNPGRPGVWP